MRYDADGNFAQVWAVADMNCDGVLNFDDIDPFVTAMNSQAAYEAAYPNCEWLNGDLDGNGIVNFDDLDYFVALLSNGGGGVQALLSWDAENRLVAYTPSFPQAGDQKVEFSYDYRNRRIAKLVYDWDTQTSDWSATATLHTKYVYDGRRLLLELDGLNSDAIVRQYTWDLDLSGSRGSAGGIGGLLAVHQEEIGGGAGAGGLDAGDYVYTHDANGNVAQAIAWATITSAKPRHRSTKTRTVREIRCRIRCSNLPRDLAACRSKITPMMRTSVIAKTCERIQILASPLMARGWALLDSNQ